MKPSLSPETQAASSSIPAPSHLDTGDGSSVGSTRFSGACLGAGSGALLLRIPLCAASLASYGLLTENLGRLGEATSRYLGLLTLAIVVLLVRACRTPPPSRSDASNPWRWPIALAPWAGVLVAVRFPHVGIPWTFLALATNLEREDSSEPKSDSPNSLTGFLLRALSGGILVAGLLELAISGLDRGWWIEENISTALTSVASTITRQEVPYGPTALGVPILFAALGTWITAGFMSRFHRPVVWILVGLCLIAAVVLQTVLPELILTLLVSLVDLFPREGIGIGEARIHTTWLHAPLDWLQLREPWHHLWMLTVLFALPLVLIISQRRVFDSTRSRLRAPSWVGVALVIPLAFLLRNSDSDGVVQAAESKRRALLYNEPHLDMRTPNFGAFMESSGGMFGLLPRLLAATGYQVEVGDLEEGRLEEADLLVLVNLQSTFSDSIRTRILERVEEGASLLVLSDHTGMESIREPVNHLLGNLGLELRFDSAVAFDQTWQDQMEFHLHPITRGIRQSDDAQVWIGASIEVRPPARPLVFGKYAYGDPGDVYAEDRNFLGDLAYGRGEPLGDLPLVASRTLGKGRILLFGDTSSFQNLSMSLGARFCIQSLRWLAGDGADRALGLLPTFVLLSVVTLVLLVRNVPLFPTLIAGAALQALPFVLLPDDGFPASQFKDRIAIVQSGHGERINLDTTEGHSAGGLIKNLLRNDLFPLLLRKHEAEVLSQAEAVFLIAPTRPLEGKEVDQLLDRAESGATIVVSAASSDAAGVEPLLSRIGVSIAPIPLGKLTIEKPDYAVKLHEASPLFTEGTAYESLLEFKGYLVGASFPRGQGRIVVIGDTDFFLNHNLEGRENVEMGNVFFLRDLLSEDSK